LTEELKPDTAPENGGLEGEKNFLRKRFFNVRTLISLVLAIGLIVVILTQFNVDFSEMWKDIQACNPWYYALAFLCYYLTFPLRALRWRYLLHHAGIRKDQGVEIPSLPALTQMVIMNWFANSILYARLGDAYRAYLFKDRTGVSFSKTLGTLLAERFLDVLVVVLLTVVSIIWLLLTGGHDWKVFGIVLGIGIVLLFGIAIVLGGMGKFGHKLVNLLPKKIRVFYTLFEQGALSSFGQLRMLTFMTVVIWLLEAGRLILVAQALGIFGVEVGIEVGIPLFIFAALANALITAVPLTPGGLGLVEGGVTKLLQISLKETTALLVTLVDRTISFLSVIVVGLLVFAYWHVMEAVRKRRLVRADIK
jgi:uncharacterized protein (TIRG00374 family)